MKTINFCILTIVIVLCLPDTGYAESPYRISREKDGYIFGAGITSAAGGYILYRSVSPPAPADIEKLSRSSISRFDRSAADHYSRRIDNSSDILAGTIALFPFALLADKTVRDDWLTISIMYVEVWSFIGAASFLSKGGIERYRPYVYNPGAPLDKKIIADAKMSFLSNHTMTVFAFAVFTSTVYNDYYPNSELRPYIWAGSLIAAGITGYLRYQSGMHFPTDIIAGAAVGSLIGYAIPWLHRDGKESISVTPNFYGGNYSFCISLKF
ncbi:MAG: phosphatase PAP2 family protein [Bacteroidetes bacterium]|nr:phosphatase PAP2 family protein [Bacteroidota bacterium]